MASTVSSRPIPALYTVYILRSTMRHASLYIGSTPDPPRRLKQHNGVVKGGAARTARASLRPWEMVGLVSGFPGPVAALKFEWALTNPHLSLHIPAESRLSVARQTKKNGHPRRPPASMHSILANLHLLLRVPSFARWPLRLHVFVPEVHAAWNKWTSEAAAAAAAAVDAPEALLAEPVEVLTDFKPSVPDMYGADEAELGPAWGIHALPLDYGPMRDYVDKANDIFTFEREGDCAVCNTPLPAGQGLYAVCPNAGCEAVGHLRCWSGHLLESETHNHDNGHEHDHEHEHEHEHSHDLGDGPLVPKRGHCPDCGGPVIWGDMMKELTLRMRAPKEVEKIVKAKRRQEKAADKAAADADKAASKAAAAVAAEELPSSIEIVPSAAAKTTKTTKTTKTARATKPATTKTKAKAKEPEKATKITKTTRVTKAASATLSQTAKTAKTTTTAAVGDASAVLLDRAKSPEVIVL
ncbi:Slx4p interacting protein [Sporothrix curviconia]|uniref:Slx4p interacting protein n=1 Tax=Sporothrix curviconia TaxID=1260050 RepID=A0ABP0AYJ5_9PEZI